MVLKWLDFAMNIYNHKITLGSQTHKKWKIVKPLNKLALQ